MENEYISADVSEKIKKRLKEFGTTAEQMLSELGMGKRTLQNYKASMPKADNLAKIADYLDCSVDYLLGRTDDPNSPSLNLNVGNHIVLGDCCQNNPVVIGKAAAGSEPDELEQEVIRILKELPIRKRTELLTVMYQYLDENKKKEDENLVDES